MKKNWFLFLSLFFLNISLFAESILIINTPNTEKALPKNFRSTHDPYFLEEEPLPSRKGLDDLNASASGQFAENELLVLTEKVKEYSLVIIDLREESHGFINGHAVSWYVPRNWGNADLNPSEIEIDEKLRLDEIKEQKNTIVNKVIQKSIQYPLYPCFKIPMLIKECCSERELTQKYNIGYFRLPIRDHFKPSDFQIERFIHFIRSLPKNAWVHFHCSQGWGRATTLLTLYDILTNGKNVSFDDIIDRQWHIGGKNLSLAPPEFSWKYPLNQQRWEFIKLFYQFAQEEQDISWKNWKAQVLQVR